MNREYGGYGKVFDLGGDSEYENGRPKWWLMGWSLGRSLLMCCIKHRCTRKVNIMEYWHNRGKKGLKLKGTMDLWRISIVTRRKMADIDIVLTITP